MMKWLLCLRTMWRCYSICEKNTFVASRQMSSLRLRMKSGYAMWPLCDIAEHHSHPTVKKQGRNLVITSIQRKSENTAITEKSQTQEDKCSCSPVGQTCWQRLLSPWVEYKYRFNMAHTQSWIKQISLNCTRWQFASSSQTWCHSSAIVCQSCCACLVLCMFGSLHTNGMSEISVSRNHPTRQASQAKIQFSFWEACFRSENRNTQEGDIGCQDVNQSKKSIKHSGWRFRKLQKQSQDGL